MEKVPPEILLHILSFLPYSPKEFIGYFAVNRLWREVASTRALSTFNEEEMRSHFWWVQGLNWGEHWTSVFMRAAVYSSVATATCYQCERKIFSSSQPKFPSKVLKRLLSQQKPCHCEPCWSKIRVKSEADLSTLFTEEEIDSIEVDDIIQVMVGTCLTLSRCDPLRDSTLTPNFWCGQNHEVSSNWWGNFSLLKTWSSPNKRWGPLSRPCFTRAKLDWNPKFNDPSMQHVEKNSS